VSSLKTKEEYAIEKPGLFKSFLKKLKIIKSYLFSPYHRLRHWLNRKFRAEKADAWLGLLSTSAWLLIVLEPSIMGGNGSLLLYGSAFVMLGTRIYGPAVRLLSQEDDVKYKIKRRIQTANCIDELARIIDDPQSSKIEDILDIRRRLLECIVKHVREYRNDFAGVKIYSNLLIRQEDEIEVVVRNDPNRRVPCRYPKDSLLCNEVFDTSTTTTCGDVSCYSHRQTDYKSFMALPVCDYKDGRCLAVVTIDSTEPYHFDDIYELIETMLRPYTRTLAITFTLEKQISST
jgi:hypothetical protein